MKRYKSGSQKEIPSERADRGASAVLPEGNIGLETVDETASEVPGESATRDESDRSSVTLTTPSATVAANEVDERDEIHEVKGIEERESPGNVGEPDLADSVTREEADLPETLPLHDVATEAPEDISGENEEETYVLPRRRTFTPPAREQIVAWLPFIGVVLLGIILRFWGLGDKPLHHDESLHAYFSLQLMHNMENWLSCFNQTMVCYQYSPVLHGPFQFHAIAFVYKISQLVGAPDHGVNTTTVRIAAATLGSLIVALPYFLRDYLGKITAWLACLFLAISPSMVYFSRFAREDIYMAFFTLLLVVAVARYLRNHKIGTLILAAVAFTLSYATKEATFLTIAIFGSFFGALMAWEWGVKKPLRGLFRDEVSFARRLPVTAAPLAVLLYFVILAPIAKVFFGYIKSLSDYIANPANANASNLYVAQLKAVTVALVPWVGIALGIFVLITLARELELFARWPLTQRRADRFDAEKQPLLATIFTMPWTHWFFALICGWAVFLLLFTVLFTNIAGGIGDGIWQGIYYWLQQQQVARGGQPWYYYLMLIPLYEQVGVVFGLVGIVRIVRHPSPFRLFLVWWFVGSFFIYSWAGEKMPWLTIHMTMPLMLLAAIGAEPIVKTLVALVKDRLARPTAIMVEGSVVVAPRPRVGGIAAGKALVGGILLLLLLAPTVQNMYQLSYVHAADGPHEMMVYVQTTTDINIVMSKIDALDQKLTGGKHLLSIGVMPNAEWPFYWYLRDYTNTCFGFPQNCTGWQPVVILTGAEDIASAQAQYASSPSVGTAPGYLFHQYHLRSWWDEGYKPPPCVPSGTNTCAGEPTWGGLGPLVWLSYGDTPPPGAGFNPGLAINNIWQWWWQRKAIGSTLGSYDMGVFIRTQDVNQTGVTP